MSMYRHSLWTLYSCQLPVLFHSITSLKTYQPSVNMDIRVYKTHLFSCITQKTVPNIYMIKHPVTKFTRNVKQTIIIPYRAKRIVMRKLNNTSLDYFFQCFWIYLNDPVSVTINTRQLKNKVFCTVLCYLPSVLLTFLVMYAKHFCVGTQCENWDKV